MELKMHLNIRKLALKLFKLHCLKKNGNNKTCKKLHSNRYEKEWIYQVFAVIAKCS